MERLELLMEFNNVLVRIRDVVHERGKYDVDQDVSGLLAKLAEALDDHHHAPRCPANHGHGAWPVRYPCTCGAWRRGNLMTNYPALGRQS